MMRSAAWLMLAAAVVPRPGRAQQVALSSTASRPVAGCATRAVSPDRGSTWAAPLDRIVTIRVADASLRDALDRIAAEARLELSYSVELLPAGERVCFTLDRVPVGAVLETLLAATSLRPVVVGSSQVVLAPMRGTPASAAALPAVRRASVLDRVVVTGTPDGGSQRSSPFALDVIDGVALSRTESSTLGEALELAVPGLWTWSSGAGTVMARFGSVRGASSFAVTTPKIYLDGIEVANPMLVTQMQASRIDRVEVIRGPQGAALYGADAISGVINIITRHDGSGQNRARVMQLSTSAGVMSSDFTSANPFVQQHAVSVRGGAARYTYGAGLDAGTVGAYVPGASERNLLADADLRIVGARAVLTTIARLSVQRANASTVPSFDVTSYPNGPTGRPGGMNSGYSTWSHAETSPGASSSSSSSSLAPGAAPSQLQSSQLLQSLQGSQSSQPSDSAARFVGDSAIGQKVSQYTLGSTLVMMPSLRWTGTVIAGVDGFRLRGLSNAGLAVGQGAGRDPLTGESAGDRGSLRARAVGRFDLTPRTTFALTLGIEDALTRQLTQSSGAWDAMEFVRDRMPGSGEPGQGSGTPPPFGDDGNGRNDWRPPARPPTTVEVVPSADGVASSWRNNVGVLAQGNLAWRDALFVAVGGRVERTTDETSPAQNAILPMLGVSAVRDVRGVVAKARVAYGTGIRPAQNLARSATWIGQAQLASDALQPESQTGVEGGIDLLFGRTMQLHLTRFDQRASGLIQPVLSTGIAVVNGARVPVALYGLENIGAITNRGWEMQASGAWRAWHAAAAYALTDSRVDRVAGGYSGELRVGDRVLEVPARTLSATLGWQRARWTASATVARAEDWIGYDRVSLGRALADDGRERRQLGGALLRNYWVRYDDVTRLRANIGVNVLRGLSVHLIGDNLLDVQRGAPDYTTITAGRTFTLGLRTQF